MLGLIFFYLVDSYYRIAIKLVSCKYTICYKMFPFIVTSLILFGGTLLISPLYETSRCIGVGRREWWVQKTDSRVIFCLHRHSGVITTTKCQPPAGGFSSPLTVKWKRSAFPDCIFPLEQTVRVLLSNYLSHTRDTEWQV